MEREIASLNLLVTSTVWRQDHNGFTHQDPGFLDVVVNESAEVTRIYLGNTSFDSPSSNGRKWGWRDRLAILLLWWVAISYGVPLNATTRGKTSGSDRIVFPVTPTRPMLAEVILVHDEAKFDEVKFSCQKILCLGRRQHNYLGVWWRPEKNRRRLTGAIWENRGVYYLSVGRLKSRDGPSPLEITWSPALTRV